MLAVVDFSALRLSACKHLQLFRFVKSENMISEDINRTGKKTEYQSNGDLMSNSSNTSSISSLKSRLRNLPLPTLDERLAAFDRRLQWNEWKWRVHQQDDLLEGKVDEKDEAEYTNKNLKNQVNSGLPGLALHRMNSQASFKSRIARPCSTVSRQKETCNFSAQATQKLVRSPQESSSSLKGNLLLRKVDGNTNSSVEWLKKRLAASLKESQGSCELPLLPNKNYFVTRRSRSLDTRYQPEDSSGSDRTIRDRSIDQQMRNQKRESSSTRSKLSDSSSSELNLPCIKSRSNLASAASKSRRELLHLTNQFQPTCQLSKTRLSMQTGERIKSLYFRENPFPQESISSFESKNVARSSMSTPKEKPDAMKNFDCLTPPGFYTDRPKSSKKVTSTIRTRSGAFDGDRDDCSSDARNEIPLLNIRSLSNSIDSDETYTIYSTRTDEMRHAPESKSSGSNNCTCFRTSKTSTEDSSWSSREAKNSEDFQLTPAIRRSVSKIPVRITSDWKKSSSLSSESKSPSDRSDNSHVSEYESKTMVVVTSSQSLLKPGVSDECSGKSIIYRVSITSENENVGPEKKLQALVPAMLMNIPNESSLDKNLVVKYETSEMKDEEKDEEKMNPETQKVELIDIGSETKDDNQSEGVEVHEAGDQNSSEIDEESNVQIAEERGTEEEEADENKRVEMKVEVEEESGPKSDDAKEESIVWKNYLAFVKSESAFDLQTKREDQINLLPGSVSTSKLSSSLEQRKEGQDRFPFTISLNEKAKSNLSERSNKVNRKNELTKHPSLIRLASIGLEPNSSEIYNFLYVHPSTKNYDRKKKGFFNRLFKWFSSSKTKNKKVVEFKRGQTIFNAKEDTLASRSTLSVNNIEPVCALPREEDEPDEIRDIFNNDKFCERGDEWVKRFDSTNELNKSQELNLQTDKPSFAEKKQKELSKTENESVFSRRIILPYELKAEQSDCLCFRWCHV